VSHVVLAAVARRSSQAASASESRASQADLSRGPRCPLAAFAESLSRGQLPVRHVTHWHRRERLVRREPLTWSSLPTRSLLRCPLAAFSAAAVVVDDDDDEGEDDEDARFAENPAAAAAAASRAAPAVQAPLALVIVLKGQRPGIP
jgi:hypothetical protein